MGFIIMVELINNAGVSTRFRIDHASRILDFEMRIKSKNWRLPDDSEYIFENGKIIKRASDQSDKESDKHERDSESDQGTSEVQPPRRNRNRSRVPGTRGS